MNNINNMNFNNNLNNMNNINMNQFRGNNMNFNVNNGNNFNPNVSNVSKPQEKIKLNYGSLQKNQEDEFVEVEDTSKGKGGFNSILESNFVDLKNLKKNK